MSATSSAVLASGTFLVYHLSLFLNVAVIKHHYKSNLGQKGFSLSHSYKCFRSITAAGKPRHQECEAANHTHSKAERQRAYCLLMLNSSLPFDSVQGPAYEMVLPICRVCLPSSINPDEKKSLIATTIYQLNVDNSSLRLSSLR